MKMCQTVIVVNDENDDVEGNLVMAASHASAQAIAFMIKNGSGIVSVGMKGEDLERLKLPLMSPENEDDASAPSFAITVVHTNHSTLFRLDYEIVICLSLIRGYIY